MHLTRALALPLICLTTSSILLGCGPLIKAQSEAFNFSGEIYEPRVLPTRIQVFEDEKPTRKYVKLARIVAEPVYGNAEDAFEELKKRAAMMGADAVMDVVFDAEAREYTTPGSITTTERKEPDKNGGVEKKSVTTVTQPTTHHYRKTILRGMAIRYLD